MHKTHHSQTSEQQEKKLWNATEKLHVNYRAKPMWMTVDFSSEPVEARRKPESFSGAARQELATQNPIHRKNILQ